jgi:hypothetical protein
MWYQSISTAAPEGLGSAEDGALALGGAALDGAALDGAVVAPPPVEQALKTSAALATSVATRRWTIIPFSSSSRRSVR